MLEAQKNLPRPSRYTFIFLLKISFWVRCNVEYRAPPHDVKILRKKLA